MLAYLKYAAKAALAFLALLATNVAVAFFQDGQPIPNTRAQWITFAITTIGGTWLVFRQTNGPKPTGKHTAVAE